jgi:hypothetical protein
MTQTPMVKNRETKFKIFKKILKKKKKKKKKKKEKIRPGISSVLNNLRRHP